MATPRTRSRRTARLCRAVLAAAGVIGVLLTAAPAQAAPSTATEAAQLVAARGHDLEVVTEQFNEAGATLETHRAAAIAAKATLAQAAAARTAAQQKVRGIAPSAWTSDG